mmetsp:Transcript_12238/g.23038  ORF Transcript_12238/g.23038 Transcript_12238/m.23038 type:complete len:453 (-) Transcript_12238:18-1376(-)
MIRYKKTWNGLFIVVRWAGTAWPHGIPPGCLAAAISLTLSHWEAADGKIRDRETFVGHPYAFRLFAYLLGVLMVFRTNFAYHRYWEAMGMVQAMGSKWLDGACMGVVFDAGGKNNTHLLYGSADEASRRDHEKTKGKGGPPHSIFVSDLIHLCSLLHALALQHLRQDDDLDNITTAFDHNGHSVRGSITTAPADQLISSPSSLRARIGYVTYSAKDVKSKYSQQYLPVLGGLSRKEREAIEYKFQGVPMTTEARVAMVESWFMRRLLARQKFEQGESAATSPPILSRLYQVISDGSLKFQHASKIALTPFPFPYHNLIGIFLWLYTFIVPILVNGTIMEDALRAIVCFCITFCYHALNQVGYNLEDPFMAYDPNELPLQEVQNSVNMRLCAFCISPSPSEMEPVWDWVNSEDEVEVDNAAKTASSTVDIDNGVPSSAGAKNGPMAVQVGVVK